MRNQKIESRSPKTEYSCIVVNNDVGRSLVALYSKEHKQLVSFLGENNIVYTLKLLENPISFDYYIEELHFYSLYDLHFFRLCTPNLFLTCNSWGERYDQRL